jgi:serine/threonine protein kinase
LGEYNLLDHEALLPLNGGDPLCGGATVAGRYRLISFLGEGGMGTAYRAWDSHRGVPVVIKWPQPHILQNPVARERFQREVRIMAALSHPDIVPVFDHGEESRVGPYIVLRFLPGGCLRDRHATSSGGVRKPMAAATLRSWLPGIASALDYLHSRNVVHRDVKPTNIFFDAHSKAYLGDFGIAKVFADSDGLLHESSLTNDLPPGTLPYMPPEAFSTGDHDTTKGDQYALAMCVYEWLVGRLPFSGSQATVISQIIANDIPPLSRHRSSLPLGISLAVGHALQRDPAERFESCTRFSEAVLREVGLLEKSAGEYVLLCPGCDMLIRIFHGLSGRTCRCPKCKVRLHVSRDVDSLWLADEEKPLGAGDSDRQRTNRSDGPAGRSTEYETYSDSSAFRLLPPLGFGGKVRWRTAVVILCAIVTAIISTVFMWGARS